MLVIPAIALMAKKAIERNERERKDMIASHKIQVAIAQILETGGIGGAHHKMWTLDQVLRILTDCPLVEVEATDSKGQRYTYETRGKSPEYTEIITRYCDGEDGPETYSWDEGIAP